MEKYIKKTANLKKLKEETDDLISNLENIEKNLSNIKDFFYKNYRNKVFNSIMNKFIFTKYYILDFIEKINEIKEL